ncbi:MAG: hypothetical protein ABF533_01420, partial [Acetobacter persici]
RGGWWGGPGWGGWVYPGYAWGYPGYGWGYVVWGSPYWGGGWGWGAPFAFGSVVGLAIGAAAASAAEESYQAPQTMYAPPSYYAEPTEAPVAQGGYPSDTQPAYYGTAPQAAPQGSDVVHCSAGRFFNSLTESCDKR